MRLAILRLCLVVTVHAATLADARRVVARLGEAAAAQDEQYITTAYGPRAYRDRTGAVSWRAVWEEVTPARAVVDHPVRTFSAEGIVTVVGWHDRVLVAAHFITRRGTLTVESLTPLTTARDAHDREALARYIRALPTERLARGFVAGDGAVISRIAHEASVLIAPHAAAPAPTPVPARDSLRALLDRYERFWFGHVCAQLPTLYAAQATVMDPVSTIDYDGIAQFCAASAPRPECSLNLVDQAPTSHGMTAHLETMCVAGPGTMSVRSKTLDITITNGAYRIVRETQTP